MNTEEKKAHDELIQQNQQLKLTIKHLEGIIEAELKNNRILQVEKEKLMADFIEVQTDLQNKIFELEKQLEK